MANKTVGVDVKYSVDKNSLNELRKQLIDLRMEAEKAKIGGSLTKGLEEASKAASKLGDILDKSWNSKLNQLDLSKVNNEIKTTYGSVEKLKQAFSNSGAAGATAYNNFAMSVLNTNTQLKKTSETLDKMAITFKNTVRYGISSAVFNNLSNSIQRAYNYAKELDTSLNDIRIVTGKSADEMDNFAIRANRVAKELGRSTKDFTNAALIYYQQGLGNEEAQARAEVTMKAANVTGQSGREVSEQLTAVWNGYKVTADEAELYVDKLAAVAATTASDLEELSTGMSKVASAANLMGVDIDQLNAQLATIVSVTRQAPESVGTALKTIYARMGDIKAGLDDEVTLGKYTSQMAQYGINVLNANGQLRDMGEVIEEIGGKWTSMSREQQVALSQVMAGTRQYNNLLALFDGWDTYTNALETSAKAAGTLQKQQDIYMESTEAHLQKLSTEAERTYDILFDQNAVNGFADALTGVLNIFNNLLAGLGGGINDFVFFGSTIANIFNKQIGQSIERQIENIEIMRTNASKEEIQRQIIATHSARGENVTNASALDKEAELMKKTLELQKYLTQEQLEQLSNSTAEIGVLEQRIQNAEQYGKIANKYMSDYMDAEEATVEDFKEELKVQNELWDAEKNKYNILKDSLLSYNERDKFYKLEKEQQEDIVNAIKESTTGLKNQEAVARIIATIEKEAKGDKIDEKALENDIKIVLKEQRDIRNQQKQAVDEVKMGLQGIQDKESHILENSKEQLEVDQKTVKAIHEQGERQKMLSELTQGLSAAISLGTATVGIIKTIGDETLSSGEKVERVLSVALSNLPILLMNLSSLGKLLPNISAATKTLAITMGIEGVTAASSFSAALAGILTTIAPYVLAIGAVAAGIYALVKAYNADKDAMEAASKNLQLITDDYNKAKEAAEGLKQTISNYNEEIQALDELKKGTEEYTKALEKANETAKKLIETYNLYDEYYYEDGLLKINEQALQKAQQNANNASNALERQMYLSRDQYNQKSLRANQTELRRSTGSAFNARGLWNDIFAPLTGGLTLLDNTINITDNEISSIVSTLRDVKNEDEEYYNKITQSNVALEKWINETYNGNERMQLLSNNIGEQVSSFKALVTQTDEMADAQKRYIKALNLSDLENRYGQHFESLLGNSGQAQQALDLLNRTSTEENLQNARNRRRNEDNFLRNYENRLGQNLYDNPELWKNEFGSNKNTLVTNVLKSIGLTEQQLINTLGYSEITSNQQLADAWAKVKNIDVSQATFKDNKYVNTAGETLIDVSSSDTRGTIRKNLTETVGMWFEDQDLEQFYEGLRNENVKLIDNLVLQAKTGGEKFGTDFSSTVLDYLSNPSSGFNLNSLIGQLSPSEIEAIQKMSAEDVSTMLGLTPDVLAEWGGKTTKEVGEEFQKAASEMPWDIDKAIETELANIQDKMPEGLTKKKMAEYEDSIRDYAKHLMEIAEAEEEVADGSDDLADTLKEDARSAILVSNSVIRMNKAINTLADNQEEWIDILKNSSIESEEYSKSLNNLRETMGDLFDLSEDTERYLDGEFFTQNAKLIEEAATGSEQAIERLRDLAADKILLEIVLDNGFDETQAQAFQNVLNEIQAQIPNFKVGADFDFDGLDASEQDFIDKCQNLVDVANMTAEQANSFFESMGFEAEFETEEKPIKKKGHQTVTESTVESVETVRTPDGQGEYTFPSKISTKTYPGEAYEYTDYVEAIAMTTDGTKPKIKSLTKKASGGMNNYSSKNPGGGSPGKSSSNKSGGGGSKAKQPSSMKQITDESDRYHDINIELGNISTKLQRLDSQKKKLFGQDLINATNEEINLLNQQIEATNVKLGLMDEELEELKPKLLDKGFNLDASGVVTNYKDLIDAKIKSVKELIDAYNAMSAEEQEQAKQGIQDAQDDLKETIDIVNKYENLKYKEREDLINDRQKALDEITTRNIEKFNMEVEIRLDMAEAERDWNKFKREIIDGLDEEKQLAKFIDARLDDFSSYYAGNGEGSIASLTKQVNSTLVELQKMDAGQANIYGNNRTQGLEDLKKWYTELMKNLEDVQALEKEIHESYIKMQDQAQKKFDEQVETFELIGDLIDHDMKVIQLVYGEDSYSALDKYYQRQENNNNQQLDFYRRQVEFWKNQMDAAEKSSEAWENAKEKWEDAVKNWKDLIIDSIEDLQDRYLNTINNIFDKLNDNITNGLGLEYVNEQWTLINKNADQYLDSINALYETQALENKYLDAIDKTDSIGAQRQLKELMDAELKDLRERDKLTQYDVERANKKYEIALKQIALQEAQQNKTKMRLRRDSQGNYRYEYISDGNQIDQMQDEINSMYNSLYNFDKARYQENLGQIYDAWSEFQEKMAEAAQINDPQERAERELLLQEQYGELINGLVEQNSQVRTNLQESAFEGLSRLYDEDSKAYQDMVNMETDALMNQLVPQWESGVQQMADNFAGEEGFLGVCKQAFEELHDATNDYEDSLNELEKTADEDFNSIYKGIDDTIEVTEDLLTSNDELIGQYKDQLTAISDVISELDTLKSKYNEVAEAAKKAVQAGYEYQSKSNKQAADAARTGVTDGSPAHSLKRPSEGNTSDSNSDTKSGLAGVGDGNLIVGESATYTGKYYYDSYGTAPVGSRYSGVANGVVVDRITNNPYGIHIHSADGKFMDLGWIKKSQLSGYDTGGYTGAWGNDGRLALLHQKELVLNAKDTENMLNAVTIMRDITSVLGTSVLNRLAGIAAAGANGTANNGLLDQNVNIQATFPNVTSSHEIEDALNNLVNMAAIRANRKGS